MTNAVLEYCADCGHLRTWHTGASKCNRHRVETDGSVVPCECLGWQAALTLAELVETEEVGVAAVAGEVRIYDGERPAHAGDVPTGKLLTTRQLPIERELDAARARHRSTSIGLSEAEKAVRKAARAPVVRALTRLASELAARAGGLGITVADLRLAAVRDGLLPQSGDGRELSYLGAVLKRAGLARTTYTRRSVIGSSHGNTHRIWVAPEYAERK